MATDERMKVIVEPETTASISYLASELELTDAKVRKMALEVGVEELMRKANGVQGDKRAEDNALQRQLDALKSQASAAAEASTGALALLSLVLPRFCKVEGKHDELFAELGGKGPLDIYHAGCCFGRSIAAAGDTYPAAYSKIPEIVGIDTERAFGLSLTEFKDLLADADRKERGKRGKKRAR